MQKITTAEGVVTAAYSSLVSVVLILFILPRMGPVATMLGCATILSAQVWATPEQFRTRRGSLKLAVALGTFLWALTAIVAALKLTGAVID